MTNCIIIEHAYLRVVHDLRRSYDITPNDRPSEIETRPNSVTPVGTFQLLKHTVQVISLNCYRL